MTPEEREQIKRIEHVERLEQENARLRTALAGVRTLFSGNSKYYIRKLGAPITNGDQDQIDAVFIAIDAALEPEKEQQG